MKQKIICISIIIILILSISKFQNEQKSNYIVRFDLNKATIENIYMNAKRLNLKNIELLNPSGIKNLGVKEGIFKIVLQEKAFINNIENSLKSIDGFKEIVTNFKLELAQVPNDRYINKQGCLEFISADKAWDITTGSKNIKVALIDSGIDYEHKDLVDNMWKNPNEIANNIDDDKNGYVDDIYGYDFIDNDSNPMDELNHGTLCAGIIGATGNNKIGVTGVAWNCEIASLKIFSRKSDDDASAAIKAIDYAISMDFDIISASWGDSEEYYGKLLPILKETISKYKGVFVTASGNAGMNIEKTPFVPASFGLDNMIVVGASTHYDKLASFSNYGAKSVDVLAPGVDIYSTFPRDNYNMFSGTSAATPLISGVCVLLKTVNKNLSANDMRKYIINGSEKIDSLKGYSKSNGRINIYKTLQLAKEDIK